ncbi:unnamed protein product [Chondrus crispus]|uniref:Integrase catalytic domain-containing protein n=1 Tax=Chondrus crispus TaxID=2769 RepID=R7QH76_CHOCR|nr:unnamed protein product [Chondrus crispus]CDF36780.1 unnamed protein product [Chondrus crispus]|eukprot:XP_005716599.1 unnamed protein product [Chondrus crispus]
MIVDAANDLLESKIRAWSFPLTRKLGHLYLEWDYGIFYTSEEMLKLHKHFFHPDSGRLYAMLKRADNASTTPSDLKELERVASECDVCQRNVAAPSRFRTALPSDDVVLNRCVCMDIMFLEGKAVLHMVDKDTKFSAAAFLPKQTVDELWSTYLSHWILPYIGHALEIHADQGPQFRSRRFASYTSMEGVQLRLSGVESHNSLGVGERYHHYLRRIFRKIRDEFPDIPMKDALRLATKAMNDTAGPKGLVPSLLVFGVMPRILLPGSVQLPGQVQRMNAMQAARKDMSKEVARSRLSTALRSNVPAATNRDVSIGSEVLVFKEPLVNKWVGPFHVLDVRDKSVFINSQGRTTQMSIDKVRPYLRPMHNEKPSTTEPSEYNPSNNTTSKGLSPAEASNAWLESLRDPLQDLFSSPAEDNAISPDEFYMEFATFLTEVIESSDPRSKNAAFFSVRMIASFSASKRFRIFSHDVTQAYTQIDECLLRELYLQPKPADAPLFSLNARQVLKLIKPIYGTTDAATLHKFDSRPRQWDKVEFYGMQIESTPGSSVRIHQPDHIQRIEMLPEDATFEHFRSARAALAWITHTRPDIACYVNKAAQVTEKAFESRHIEAFNRCIKYLKREPLQLSFDPLNIETLQIRVYADAAFGTNLDCTSQLGYVIMLFDANNAAHIIDFSSKKSRRVVRSIMGGEIFALADGFDRAFMLGHDLERMYDRKIPLYVLTDSKQVFDTITKASKTTERRLLIDIAAARQAYNRQEISNIGLVASEDMVADGLTKTNAGHH